MKNLDFAFHKPIRKILQDFDRLTLIMRDKLVSRTTNPIENYGSPQD
jgi:hypothetical protein